MQEGRDEIDKDLAELNGNVNAFRLSESMAFVESMNQAFAQQIIYGDTTTNKDGVLGLTPRYNAITGSPAPNSAAARCRATPGARRAGIRCRCRCAAGQSFPSAGR